MNTTNNASLAKGLAIINLLCLLMFIGLIIGHYSLNWGHISGSETTLIGATSVQLSLAEVPVENKILSASQELDTEPVFAEEVESGVTQKQRIRSSSALDGQRKALLGLLVLLSRG